MKRDLLLPSFSFFSDASFASNSLPLTHHHLNDRYDNDCYCNEGNDTSLSFSTSFTSPATTNTTTNGHNNQQQSPSFTKEPHPAHERANHHQKQPPHHHRKHPLKQCGDGDDGIKQPSVHAFSTHHPHSRVHLSSRLLRSVSLSGHVVQKCSRQSLPGDGCCHADGVMTTVLFLFLPPQPWSVSVIIVSPQPESHCQQSFISAYNASLTFLSLNLTRAPPQTLPQ